MFQGQWLSLGIGSVLTGLVLVILVWGILRLVTNLRPRLATVVIASPQPATQAHEDAVIIVQPGGRVEHLNDQARTWFEIPKDEQPNLERMARQVRPGDDFLLLCAAEHQARISINGRLTEGVSYRLPGPDAGILVSLHRPELAAALDMSTDGVSSLVIRVVTEFGQSIASSYSLETIIETILENIERLIPADALELKLYDETNRQFTAYRFGVIQDGKRQVEKVQDTRFGNYAHRLFEIHSSLLVSDTQSYSDAKIVENGEPITLRSYLGIPLEAFGQMVGTIELGLPSADAFAQEDLNLLQLITGQSAVALRNAVLYEEERKRADELSGLAKLAQAVGTLQDSQDLYAHLVESLGSMFDVSVLGFITYNKDSRLLEGQTPYLGIPEHVIEMFRTEVPITDKADELLNTQTALITANATEDQNWNELGLQKVALAASLHDSALVPLISGGRLLGFLHLSNHSDGTNAFTNDELRLVNIVVNQVAAIMDNAVLLQQTRRRAQRSEALRRIANLAGTMTSLDDLLTEAIRDLSQLMQADASAIFLLDESQGMLRVHETSAYGFDKELAQPLMVMYIDNPQFRYTVTNSRRAFISGRLNRDRRVLPIYRPIVDTFKIASAIVVPLVTRNRGLGEIMIGSRRENFFNNNDLDLLTTAAGQLAVAVEEVAIFSGTDEELRQRVDRMSTASRLGRELNISLDPSYQLDATYQAVRRLIDRSCCGSVVLLNTENGNPQSVRAFAGDAREKTLSELEQQVIVQGASLAIADFAQSDFDPPQDHHRAALLVPVTYHDKALGLIGVYSDEENAFGPDQIEMIETVAQHLSVALNNSLQYQNLLRRGELLRRQTETMGTLAKLTRELSVDQSLEQALNDVAQAIRRSTIFDVVLISVYEPETELLRRVAGIGIPEETLSELRARKQPWRSIQSLMKPEFQIGHSYYIPADQTPIVPSDVHMVTLSSAVSDRTPDAWHPEDFLLFPLEDSQGNPLGLVSVDGPRDGLRPDRSTIEAIEIFSTQAALLVDGIYRTSMLRERVDTLSATIDRQQRLLNTTQNNLPTLLRKDLEQTIAIHNLDRRAQRIRAGLQITESVSRHLDANSALQALGRELLTQLGMSVALVAEETTDGPRLLHVLGNVPRATSPEALFGQRNPLRTCLQNGEIMLVMNLDENDAWRETPLLTGLRAKSFICLPITMENKPFAAVLVISPEPMPALTAEDRQVYHQITRQASLILQNISLLSETRRRLQEVNLLLDFSRQLSGLDPDSIVKSLLQSSRRVLSQTAHAGMVLLVQPDSDALIPQVVSGYADNERMKQIVYQSGETLPGEVFARGVARSVDEVDFARDYNLSAENLLHYRQATGGRLPISSLLIPIQTGERKLGVMVLDNFNAPSAFSDDDQTLLLSLSQQVALSLENVRLVHDAQERAGQLEALNTVSTNLTASLRSDELIAALLDQLKLVIPFDTAILWLRNQNRLTVVAATGFTDSEERLGLTVAIEDSALLREMISTGEAITIADIREDERFPALTDTQYLSWMGIPLISKSEVVGVIALEKTKPQFYAFEYVQVASTFASQAAVALDNARLFEDSLQRAAELDQRSQRLALLNRFSGELSESLNADQVLRLTADELLSALDADYISVVSYERGVPILRDQLPAPRLELPQTLTHAPIFEHLRDSQGIFVADDITQETELGQLSARFRDTRSMLILPIVSGNEMRVLMFAHLQENNHFTSAEIELARTLGNQAGIALENARLYQSTLLTAERLRILNQVSSEISTSLEPETIYATVHWAVSQLMPVEAFVIALLDAERQDIEGVYLMDFDQRTPSIRVPLGEGLSGRVISTGQPLLISGSGQVDQMGGITFGEQGTPRSIVAVPMVLGSKVVGMLSAQSYQSNVYAEADQQILSTLANQAIVAIQNGRLFEDVNRMAEQLEQRVIERTAELEREQRNTETLLRILSEVSASLDLDRALNRTLSLLNDAIGAEQGTIMMLHPEDNLLHYRAGYGYLSSETDKERLNKQTFTLKVGDGLAGWVVKNRQPAMVPDLMEDNRWVPSATGTNHRSALVAPLIVGEDVIGTLLVFHRQPGYFSTEQLSLVQAIASQVAVAINNATLYELIRDQAERLGNMFRNEQVEASRQQAILEAVADGVLVTDMGNSISFINASTERILGLNATEAIGQSLDAFVGFFGRAARAWMETIHIWSEDPASYGGFEDTYAEQINLEDGRVIMVHLAPVIMRGSEFLGTVSIFRDITHEVEVDRLKSEFVATVSHELRTPMTSIRGYVDILLMGAAGALTDGQVHFLEIIRENTERLNILVNDLLDISRIESGRVTLSLQPLDLRELAKELLSEFEKRSKTDNKPMTFLMEFPETLPPVYGDSERVSQIMSNLIDNAYNYTPQDGTIKVQMKTNETVVQVDIVDNGVGIAPHDQERVFERFFRGEDPLVLATPGTGLGLPLVKQLVLMHDGEIWMTSKGVPGEGSTFSFTLPIYRNE